MHRDKPLLKNISWEITHGQHWILMGRNGAGKTLLLNIIAGYLWPSSGDAFLLGKKIGTIDIRMLRKSIGWVSKSLMDKVPSSDSALNIILSGKFASFGIYTNVSQNDLEQGKKIAEDLKLSNILNTPFNLLSTGEQQQILLARAKMANPKLLILDEPCSNLDLAARENLLETIQCMTQDPNGPTIIMVTHQVGEIMPGFTHMLLLHQGCVLNAGNITQILTNENIGKTLEIPVNLFNLENRWQAFATSKNNR